MHPSNAAATNTAANRRRYRRIASLYDLLDWAFEAHYRPGRALAAGSATGLTLEIGAGTGKNFPYYASHAQILASDLSTAMLQRAQRRRLPPIHALLAADAAALPAAAGAVDTVVATFVSCVQADPRPLLAEVARVLKPGGQARFLEYTLPEHEPLRTCMRLLAPVLRPLYGVYWHHDLPHLLVDAGLHVQEVRPIWGPIVRLIVASKLKAPPSQPRSSPALPGSVLPPPAPIPPSAPPPLASRVLPPH